MVDKEILQAISDMMDTKLESAKSDMAQMMKAELVPINDRLDKVDARLDNMQADIADLKQNVDTISERTIKIELVHGKKLDGLYESVVGTGEKFARLDIVENKVEDYGHRIWALEQVVKK